MKSRLYKVWCGPIVREYGLNLRHNPLYIMSSDNPQLLAAAVLFEDCGSTEHREAMVQHMVVLTEPRRIRAVIKIDESGGAIPMSSGGGGGRRLEAWAIPTSIADARATRGVQIFEEYDSAMYPHSLVQAQQVLDRLQNLSLDFADNGSAEHDR